jgi:tetratricopeptide (TPR) repeat protein
VLPGIAGREDRELFLLDVLDEAMALGRGYRRKDVVVDRPAFEEGMRTELRGLVVRRNLPLDPALLANLLGESLTAVLDDETARRRGARWRRLLDAAVRWDRQMELAGVPGMAQAYARVEWLYEARGEVEAAERQVRHALEKAPENPDWLHFLGVLRFNGGRRQEGIRLVRRSIAARPMALGTRLTLARMLRTEEREQEALEAVTRGLRQSPWNRRNREALLLLAELRLMRGEKAIARSLLLTARELLAEDPPTARTEALRKSVQRLLVVASR